MRDEMKLEELLLKIDDGDNQDIHSEILRQVDNLKCCGNCYLLESRKCAKWQVYRDTGNYPEASSYCYAWQYDGLIREDREK